MPQTHLFLLDSIASISEHHVHGIIISGSHGGISAARFAVMQALACVVFNDAGIGKDNAGVQGLGLLEERGIPAFTVSHTSARIGDAADSYNNGMVSYTNALAHSAGVRVNQTVQEAIAQFCAYHQLSPSLSENFE